MLDTLDSLLKRLVAGGLRHAGREAPARAALAMDAARCIAACASRWTETAVAIKQTSLATMTGSGCVGSGSGCAPGFRFPEIWAEEMATGPLATLRLLLVTARALQEVAANRSSSRTARLLLVSALSSGPASEKNSAPTVSVNVVPARELYDHVIFRGHSGAVRCDNPGGSREAFVEAWQREAVERPAEGGVALVLGAGNVSGLAPADAICQIFEHGRAVLLKLHPLHAPLVEILSAALEPLVAAGLLAIVVADAGWAQAALSAPLVTHVHLTGGQAAFKALVWGSTDAGLTDRKPVLTKPITCELGNVTPWIIVPGRYTSAQLRCQADTVAASIAHNSSLNCIATKVIITCRSWQQRDEFLARITDRLQGLPPRPAWYPGSVAAWETLTAQQAPANGLLPVVFRTNLDPQAEPQWLAREWFTPAAAEITLEADSVAGFVTQAAAFTHALPGTLAASVTAPDGGAVADKQCVAMLLERLHYGVVALNCWSALAYAWGSVPWGGFPGATLNDPASGIGTIHNPLLLPMVRQSIIRAPLVVWPKPPWFPWHPRGFQLAHGVVQMYAAIANGSRGTASLLRMLPDVLRGA